MQIELLFTHTNLWIYLQGSSIVSFSVKVMSSQGISYNVFKLVVSRLYGNKKNERVISEMMTSYKLNLPNLTCWILSNTINVQKTVLFQIKKIYCLSTKTIIRHLSQIIKNIHWTTFSFVYEHNTIPLNAIELR